MADAQRHALEANSSTTDSFQLRVHPVGCISSSLWLLLTDTTSCAAPTLRCCSTTRASRSPYVFPVPLCEPRPCQRASLPWRAPKQSFFAVCFHFALRATCLALGLGRRVVSTSSPHQASRACAPESDASAQDPACVAFLVCQSLACCHGVAVGASRAPSLALWPCLAD